MCGRYATKESGPWRIRSPDFLVWSFESNSHDVYIDQNGERWEGKRHQFIHLKRFNIGYSLCNMHLWKKFKIIINKLTIKLTTLKFIWKIAVRLHRWDCYVPMSSKLGPNGLIMSLTIGPLVCNTLNTIFSLYNIPSIQYPLNTISLQYNILSMKYLLFHMLVGRIFYTVPCTYPVHLVRLCSSPYGPSI